MRENKRKEVRIASERDIKIFVSKLWDDIEVLEKSKRSLTRPLSLLVMYYLALRVSEAAALQTKDFTFDTLHMKYRVYISPMKNCDPRNIFLPERFNSFIGSHLDMCKENSQSSMFNLASRQSFLTYYNSYATSLSHLIKMPRGTHVLRHTRATEVYRKSKNIIAVKNWMGHRSINSTLVYVNHIDAERVALEFAGFDLK